MPTSRCWLRCPASGWAGLPAGPGRASRPPCEPAGTAPRAHPPPWRQRRPRPQTGRCTAEQGGWGREPGAGGHNSSKCRAPISNRPLRCRTRWVGVRARRGRSEQAAAGQRLGSGPAASWQQRARRPRCAAPPLRTSRTAPLQNKPYSPPRTLTVDPNTTPMPIVFSSMNWRMSSGVATSRPCGRSTTGREMGRRAGRWVGGRGVEARRTRPPAAASGARGRPAPPPVARLLAGHHPLLHVPVPAELLQGWVSHGRGRRVAVG